MRFLLEAKQIFDDLVKAKSYLESRRNIEYSDLNQRDRFNFTRDVINLMKNRNILKSNSGAVIKAIEDSIFGEKNQDVITYLNELNNNKIKDNTISLVTELIMNGNIDYAKDKTWLNNNSLYDRPSGDTDYIIKILTLASKPKLQKDYFSEPLKVDDFMKGDQIFDIAKVKDILDMRQVKDVEVVSTGEKLISNALNKDVINIDDIRAYTKNLYGDKIADSVKKIIDSDQFKEYIEDNNILDNSYRSDNRSNSKDKLNSTLKNIVSKIYNSDDYEMQREEERDRLKKEKEDREKGKTGQAILSDLLKSKGKEINKESVLDYIKSLFDDTNKKSIIAGAIDSGAVDEQINDVLKARYKDTLISNAQDLLNYALKKEILAGI